jgi:hypothetical protein
MDDLIDAQARRMVMYEFRDGTGDMGFGVFSFVFALGMVLSKRLDSEAAWLAAFLAIGGAATAITHFGTRAVRARLVYQRSGYAQRRRPRPAAVARLLLAVAAASVGVAGLVGYLHGRSSGTDGGLALLSAPLIMGVGLAAMYLWAALRVRRFAVYAAVSAGLGVGLHITEPSVVAGSTWYFVAMGVALLVGGAVTLWLFVRRMPTRIQEAQ